MISLNCNKIKHYHFVVIINSYLKFVICEILGRHQDIRKTVRLIRGVISPSKPRQTNQSLSERVGCNKFVFQAIREG